MNKRTILIILAAIAVIGAGGVVVARHFTKKTHAPTIVEQKKNAPKQSEESAAATNQPAENVPVSSSTSLSGLTASQSGGVVRAKAVVNNASDASATCTFTFENPNDKPVVRETAPASNGTVCDSGAIPEQEFTYLGQWKLTLRYYSNNTQAVATTDIAIQ